MENIIKIMSVAAGWTGSVSSCKGTPTTGNAFFIHLLTPLHNGKNFDSRP